MPVLTALVLAGLVSYMVSWYLGFIQGNMALLMFMATVITGIYWLAEKLWFLPQRRQAADKMEAELTERQNQLAQQGVASDTVNMATARQHILMQPWWLDWTAGLFPIILAIFLLRSFAYEPFRIPSGSMVPTLLAGDLILVNKYEWGLRLPVLNKKVTEGNKVQRGEVIVFRYPVNPNLDYIKRVVGLPGDTVSYINKRLTINGKEVPYTPQADYMDKTAMVYFQQFQEQLGTHTHNVIVDQRRPAGIPVIANFPHSANCHYTVDGVTCKVPEGHYFVMGDNRDNSEDSRFWGFVPDENIVGKAVAVWLNFSDFKRIGRIQ